MQTHTLIPSSLYKGGGGVGPPPTPPPPPPLAFSLPYDDFEKFLALIDGVLSRLQDDVNIMQMASSNMADLAGHISLYGPLN